MADKKISQLELLTEIDGREELIVVIDGSNKKITTESIKEFVGNGSGGDIVKVIITDSIYSLQPEANKQYIFTNPLNNLELLDSDTFRDNSDFCLIEFTVGVGFSIDYTTGYWKGLDGIVFNEGNAILMGILGNKINILSWT